MEAIRKAWQARQDLVKSARFVIEESVTTRKGHYSHFVEGDSAKRVADMRKAVSLPPPIVGAVLPPKDTTNLILKEVWVDGSKHRYETSGLTSFDPIQLSFVAERYVSVADGTYVRSSRSQSDPSASPGYPSGLVRKAKRPIDSCVPTSRVFMVTCRAVDRVLACYDADSLKLTGQASKIGDDLCYSLLQKDRDSSEAILWVNPKQEFTVVRIEEIVDGRLDQRYSISYVKNENAGWVPNTWEIVTLEKNRSMRRMQQGTLKQAEINSSIPAKSFTDIYPVGCRVVDEGASKEYILRTDGTQRILTKSDRKLKYEEIVQGDVRTQANRTAWLYALVLCTVAVVLFAGAFLFRRRVRNRTGSS
jgi:hypothetical protein